MFQENIIFVFLLRALIILLPSPILIQLSQLVFFLLLLFLHYLINKEGSYDFLFFRVYPVMHVEGCSAQEKCKVIDECDSSSLSAMATSQVNS